MKKINWAFMLLFMTTLMACSNDENVMEQESVSTATTTQKKLNGKIPFTVENVQKALPEVLKHYQETKPAVAERFRNYDVKPTHIYYKFIPRDSIQYSVLMEQESVLNLTTDPLEYDRVEKTEDPGENEIPVFYAIVNIEQRLPEVPREKIAELHVTNEDNLEDAEHNYDEIEFKQNLMYQARKLAGHLDDDELAGGFLNIHKDFNEPGKDTAAKGLFPKKWRPWGVVKVEDDYLSDRRNGNKAYHQVANCRVNVLKWGFIPVESGMTNADGYFATGSTYTTHVHYNLKFTDEHKVIVKSGNFFDVANYMSDSHKRRHLDATFQRGTKMQFYALINHAAWDYFNRVVPVYGIYNPGSIEISGHFNDHNSNYWFGFVPFRSEVKIGAKESDGSRKKSDEIYATVIHEMTHKAHYKMDPGVFNSIAGTAAKHKKFLRESWAECVETQATNDRYTSYFTQYALGNYVSSPLQGWATNVIRTWNGERQYATLASMDEYSSLIIDLMDNFNQNNFNNIYPVDRVSGYTLKQIQTALNSSYTVDSFYDKLESLYNNSTEVHLNTFKTNANTIVNSL